MGAEQSATQAQERPRQTQEPAPKRRRMDTLPLVTSVLGLATKKAGQDAISQTSADTPSWQRRLMNESQYMSKSALEYLMMLDERNVFGDSIVARERPELLMSARKGLAQALATNSLRSYASAWRSWTSWARSNKLPNEEPSETDLCLYVWDKGTAVIHGLKYSTLKNYLHGISHFLSAGGPRIDLLAKYTLLDRLMQRLHRLHGSRTQDKRKPIYWSMLIQILRSGTVTTVEDRNMMALALIGREGLYRLGELAINRANSPEHPKVGHWTICEEQTYATLTILKSKTNQWRETVKVAHPYDEEQEGCAAAYLQGILKGRPQTRAQDPLFQDRAGRPITRQAFSRWLIRSLSVIGVESTGYKGHSLRIGGATELASMGVPDHMIQAMGRWRSSCYQLYRRTDVSEIVETTRRMYSRTDTGSCARERTD
jgi:hypothetical protein